MSSKNKRSPCPFASAKKPSKRKKLSKSFDKDRADILAASDRVSYFEQEKLISQDEEERSRWENETVSASRSKIEDKGKDEPAEPDSQESWQKNCCRQSLARKSREISYPDSRISLIMSCLALSPFEVVTS